MQNNKAICFSFGIRHSALVCALGLVLLGLVVAFGLVAKTGFEQPQGTQGHEQGKQNGPAPAQPLVLHPSRTLIQHTKAVQALAISPNGKVLASGGADHTILLWDTTTWKVRSLAGLPGAVADLAFSPDGSRLASVSNNRDRCAIRLWDLAAARPAGELGGPNHGMWAVAYSPDGKVLVCGGWDRKLYLFNRDSGPKPRVVADASTQFVRALSFSRDGRLVITGGYGSTRLWDARSGREVPTALKLPSDMCPSFFPNDDAFAAWSHTAGTVTICAVPTGRVRAVWRTHRTKIHGLALSPDGRFLATLGPEGVARLWAAADQSEVATLVGHRGVVYTAVFTADGARLATAGRDDFTVRLWDLPPICRVPSRAGSAAE